jgi:hypothetical protein
LEPIWGFVSFGGFNASFCGGSDKCLCRKSAGVAIFDYALDNRSSTGEGEWATGCSRNALDADLFLVLGRDALKERLTHAKDQRADAETKLAAIQQEVERQKAII